MRIWLIILLVLVLTMGTIAFAGCGSSGESGSPTDNAGGDNVEDNDSAQVSLPSTEATACAANRRTISSAAKAYQAMEGESATSVQQLVPEFLQSVPTCPAGGRYTLSGTTVTCSVHGR